MGSPLICYKEILCEYIKLNVSETNLKDKYSEDTLMKLSVEDLEKVSLLFNKNHKTYAAFLAGFAVSKFISENYNCCDILNASISAINSVQELFDIEEPDEVDYKE